MQLHLVIAAAASPPAHSVGCGFVGRGASLNDVRAWRRRQDSQKQIKRERLQMSPRPQKNTTTLRTSDLHGTQHSQVSSPYSPFYFSPPPQADSGMRGRALRSTVRPLHTAVAGRTGESSGPASCGLLQESAGQCAHRQVRERESHRTDGPAEVKKNLNRL